MKLRLTIFAIAAAVFASPERTQAQDPSVWQPTVYASHETGRAAVPQASKAPVPPASASNAVEVSLTDGNWSDGAKGGAGCAAGPCYPGNGCSLGCHCPQCTRKVLRPDWISVDFMHVWTKGRYLPPLATTSPNGTPIGVPEPAGSLPVSTVLFGGESVGDGRQTAGRLDFGKWLDDYENLGAGIRLWGVEGDETMFSQVSGGDPILAIPFFNVQTGFEDSQLVAYPSAFSGSLSILTSNDVTSAETYLRFMMARGCGYRVDLMGGYHYNRIDDGVVINSDTTALGGAPGLAAGTNFEIVDSFDARNEFHGGVLGINTEMRRGCWTLRSLAKVSFGNQRQTVVIDGTSTIFVPTGGGGGSTVVQDNGLFAQESNIGSYERDEFTYIPEVNLSLGYHVNRNLELTVGYTFVYWENVILSGDQINRNVNLSQAGGGALVGTARPSFDFRDTDFWVQGVNLGATYSF